MKKRFLFVFVTLPLMLVMIFVAFLAFGLEPALNRFKPEIETGLSQLLGKETGINGRITVKYFPRLTIVVHKPVIKTSKKPLIQADQLVLSFQTRPWPKDTLVISDVILIRPKLAIRQGLKETYLVSEKEKTPAPFYREYLVKAGLFLFATINRQIPGTMTRVQSLIIQEFKIDSGDFYLGEHKGKEILSINSIQIVLEGLYVKQFKNITGGWRLFFNKHSLSGHGSAKVLRWQKLHLQNVALKAINEEGRITFSEVKAQPSFGKATANLVVNLGNPQISYDLNLDLNEINLSRVIKTFDIKVKASGTLHTKLKITSRGSTVKALLNQLHGKLDLTGDNLTVYETDLDGMIRNYRKSQRLGVFDIGAYMVLGPLGLLASKSIDVTSIASHSGKNKKTGIPHVKFDWRIKRGVAQSWDVAFATRKYRVAAGGKLDLNTRRYRNIQIALLDSKGCIEFSQQLNGPLLKPELNSMSFVGKVLASPLTTLAKGVSSVFSTKCDVFYAGAVPHPN